MSDPNVTATPVVEASTATPAPKPAEAAGEPSWLPERLERERRSLLKKIGVDNIEDAQTALAESKAKRDAEKSAAEKAAEALQRATTAEQSTAALRAVVGEFAAKQLSGLSQEQKNAVLAIAGEDPAAQLKAITALQPTWQIAAAPIVVPTVPAKAQPPADTAPPANAPSAITTSEVNHKETYASLRKDNPFAAAKYAAEHPEAYKS